MGSSAQKKLRCPVQVPGQVQRGSGEGSGEGLGGFGAEPDHVQQGSGEQIQGFRLFKWLFRMI